MTPIKNFKSNELENNAMYKIDLKKQNNTFFGGMGFSMGFKPKKVAT